MQTQVPNPRQNTGLTSTSLERTPGPSKNFVRGKSGYVPFWPGGLEEAATDVPNLEGAVTGGKGLRTIAPGLSRGLRLPGEEAEDDMVEMLDGFQVSEKAHEVAGSWNRISYYHRNHAHCIFSRMENLFTLHWKASFPPV